MVMLETVINTEGLFPKVWNLISYSGGRGEVGGGGGATGYAILKKGLGGEGRGLVPFLILRANWSLTGSRDFRDVVRDVLLGPWNP